MHLRRPLWCQSCKDRVCVLQIFLLSGQFLPLRWACCRWLSVWVSCLACKFESTLMTMLMIHVNTSYYGADANLIQGFITEPLEQALAQANIDYMTPQSLNGRSKSPSTWRWIRSQCRFSWSAGARMRLSLVCPKKLKSPLWSWPRVSSLTDLFKVS